MNRNIRKCPYCKSKVSYFGALSELNSGEHTCPVCHKNSNISYSKMIYLPTAILLAVAIGVAGLLFWFKIITNLFLALALILIPFAAFYFLTPLYFRLEEIKNEAQNPVIIVEPKRAARKQSQTLKKDENIKVENMKKEQKSAEKTKSGESKFSKFVRTYIIVPDDDEEQPQAVPKKDAEKSEPDSVVTTDEKPVPEKTIEEITKPITDKVIETDTETKTEIKVEPIIEPKESLVEAVIPEENKDKETVSEKLAETQKESDDKPKINFSSLFSKLNFSDNKKTNLPSQNNVSEVNGVVDVKTDSVENIKGGEPVYHRLTKTNKVNFIYFPDKKAIISVDLNVPDSDEKTEENKIDVDVIETAEPESIELVVEKALEVEKDEEENREIMNFFTAQPSDEEEQEFGEKPADEQISEAQPETTVENTEEIREEISDYNDGWVEYAPETGDFITLRFEEPEKIVPDNNVLKNDLSSNDIIKLSDITFDLPKSDDIEKESIKADDNFIDYDAEDEMPVIVVDDEKKSAKAKSDTSKTKNKPVKDKAKFGLFSKYVSKLKNENISDAEEAQKEKSVKTEKVIENESKLDIISDHEAEINQFDEELTSTVTNIVAEGDFATEKAIETALDYESKSDVLSENVTKVDIDSIPVTENYDEPEHDVFEVNEDNSVLAEIDEASKAVTESDIENVSVTYEVEESKPEITQFEYNLPSPVEVSEIIENESKADVVSENVIELDIEGDSVKDNELTELESIEISEYENEVSDDELEIFKPEEFMYNELFAQESDSKDELVGVDNENDDYYKFDEEDDEEPSDEIVENENDDDYFKFDEEDEEESSDEIVENENDDDYFKFDEEDDEESSDEIVENENDDDYFKFDEEDDEESSDEIIENENDDDYFKFDEEDDEEPSDEIIENENDDDYFKFDEEDDEDDYPTETIEGAIEFIPDEKINEDSYVVDYSDDKFENISSGEQLDKNFNLEDFRAKNSEETSQAKPIVPIKIDSSGNRVDEVKQPSRYEKKFPNAAKAAAEQAAEIELKKQKAKAQAKKKKQSSEAASKDLQKSKSTKKPQGPKNEQEQKTGFLSSLKNRIIEATEEERQAAFEEEERERKLAEKEARRKAKEKEKERAEKLKAREEKEKTRSAAGVSTAKDSYEKIEQKAASEEERRKKSQKTKRIEKSKVNIPADIPADGKTRVFETYNESSKEDYEAQEKIVLDSVKDKVRELENRKITEAEKVKIISEKVDEEKRREKIEQLKSEQEQQRVKKEKKRREKQLQDERLEKAEEIRREQVKQVQKNQNERKKSEEKRDTNNVSLKEVDNVRSKVSQKKKKRKQEIDEVL